jgi:hypothetical protein
MQHYEVIDRYPVYGAAIMPGLGLSAARQQGFSNRPVHTRTRVPESHPRCEGFWGTAIMIVMLVLPAVGAPCAR